MTEASPDFPSVLPLAMASQHDGNGFAPQGQSGHRARIGPYQRKPSAEHVSLDQFKERPSQTASRSRGIL